MKNRKLDDHINHIDNNLKSNSLKNIFKEYNTVLNEKNME